MITSFDIYKSFRQAQSNFLSRPYRLPKDWETHFNKMIQTTRDKITILVTHFNTKWMNIDIDRYFKTGFDLFGKNFSYNKFTDPKIMLLYIENDKTLKRNYILTKENFTKSKNFVIDWCKNKSIREDLSLFTQYSRMEDNGMKAPVTHYLKNKIDKYFFTWLIMEKYFVLTDEDRVLVPLITENYWTYVGQLKEMEKYDK
jgi:hypothetical protein